MTIDRREPPRVRGFEQYWVPYLKLVADLTTGRPDQAGPDPAPYDAYDLELISTWIWEGNPNTEE